MEPSPVSHASPSDLTPLNDLPRSGVSTTDRVPSPLPSSHERLRSCTICRQRKIKCDRKQPCTHCSQNGLDCIYPDGPGRASKTSRRLDTKMVNQIARLEGIVRRLQSERELDMSPSTLPEHAALTVNGVGKDSAETCISEDESIEKQLGRLVIKDTRSYYVSNVLWASLGSEIEELRDMLYESTSEDEDNESTKTTRAPLGVDATIFGFRSLAHSLLSLHPSLPQSVALFRVFSENVAPVVRIFHMPTAVKIFWEAVDSLSSLDKNTEALVFSIYYSAIISIGSEQCYATLGVSREVALHRYRFAVEQALARADLLNTESIILLQASVIFLSAMRQEDDSRATWSLTSLIFHIAQAMGLHRDGTDFGLSVFQTELRRRLWWGICLLDTRSSDYHGYEPIVRQSTFNTRLPLNINDSDLTPEMVEPPPERKEATEMTFSLIRYESTQVVWKIGFAPIGVGVSGRLDDALTMKEQEVLVEDFKQRLHERYLQYCDTSVPFLLMSLTVARLIMARLWVIVHLPRGRKNSEVLNNSDKSFRDKVFLASVEVLELSSQLMTNHEISRWTWHSKTNIQWHIVALVLSEIISRPSSLDCDRAWDYVNVSYDGWKKKENKKKGTLWRPLKRLMAKARYVREMQNAKRRGLIYHRSNSTLPSGYVTQQHQDPGWGALNPNISTFGSMPAHSGSENLPKIDMRPSFRPGDVAAEIALQKDPALEGSQLLGVSEDPMDHFFGLITGDPMVDMHLFEEIANSIEVPQGGAMY